jgi:molecular chaperone HtpG
MQRLLRDAGQPMPETLPILEINPQHPMVSQLKDAEPNSIQHPAVFLYSLALLAEGGNLSDPASFSKDISRLLNGVSFAEL